MKSQNEKVLSILKRGTLTTREAGIEFNIWRLSARIYDLRDMGHMIHTNMVGEGNTRYARYRLQHGDGTG
jgi:hypothetical protein